VAGSKLRVEPVTFFMFKQEMEIARETHMFLQEGSNKTILEDFIKEVN